MRSGPFCSTGSNGILAAAITAGRSGLPMQVALIASALSMPVIPAKPVAIALTRAAREAVGAAHHRVLLVQQGGDSQKTRGENRRYRGIAAEADHDRRPHLAHQHDRPGESIGKLHSCARDRDRIAPAEGLARHDISGFEMLAVFHGAAVRRKRCRDPALRQRRAKCLGGEQMPTGAAGGHHDERIRHQSRGCSANCRWYSCA